MSVALNSLSAVFAAQAKMVKRLNSHMSIEGTHKDDLRSILKLIDECKGHLDDIKLQVEKALEGGRTQ